jgi:hypothetical protein
MEHWTRRVGLLAALVLLSGCGAEQVDTWSRRLVGHWALRQMSTDGGHTFRDVTSPFEFELYADRTWGDSTGDSGRWRLDWTNLVVYHTGWQPTEYFRWQLFGGDRQLIITHTDSERRPTRWQSLYVRVTRPMVITRSTSAPLRPGWPSP